MHDPATTRRAQSGRSGQRRCRATNGSSPPAVDARGWCSDPPRWLRHGTRARGPVVGAPVFAIVGGVTVSLLRPVPAAVRPGLGFASKAVLQGRLWCSNGALVPAGRHDGSASVPIMIGSLAIALVGAALIGRLMGIGRDLRTLIVWGQRSAELPLLPRPMPSSRQPRRTSLTQSQRSSRSTSPLS